MLLTPPEQVWVLLRIVQSKYNLLLDMLLLVCHHPNIAYHSVNIIFFNRQPHRHSMPPFNARLDEVGMPKPSFKWRRVLLKVSGEALAGDQTQN